MELHPTRTFAAAAVVLLALAGCDNPGAPMENLELGVTTVEQVKAKWGEPAGSFTEGDAQVLEYSGQPAGQKNYMVVIGPDGKLKGIRQVLQAETIAKVGAGMGRDEVEHTLGKPARMLKYDLHPDDQVWEWHWRDGNSNKLLTVTFGPDGRVKDTASSTDKSIKDPG